MKTKSINALISYSQKTLLSLALISSYNLCNLWLMLCVSLCILRVPACSLPGADRQAGLCHCY
jgi:hypothetical protein